MIAECPKCGQRLRAGWLRCPRCRELLPDTSAPAAKAGPREPQRWRVVAAASAVVVGAGILGLMLSARSTPPQNSAAQTASVGRLDANRPKNEPKPAAPAVRAQVESAESRRAGYAAYSMGNLTSARAKFQAAVDANPSDPEARNNLGQVLVRQDRAADALPHFDEAVRLDPQKWAYRFNRGRAYGLVDRWPDAVTEYRVAAQLFPEDYATRFNLGLALMRMKQYPEAVTELEEAVKLAPSEPSFLISLGTAYVAGDKPDRAKTVFEQFLELAPDDPDASRVKALIGALDAAAAKN
jgi:tetratricopeptide (TPR) repeat protein